MENPIKVSCGMTLPPKAYIDALLRLRPGAFKTNVSLLVSLAKEFSGKDRKTLVLPQDAVRGGDCGSLNSHPAFVASLKKAETVFRKALGKLSRAPKIVYESVAPSPRSCSAPCASKNAMALPFLDGEGPDPRFPFCGRPDEVFLRQTVGLARRLASIGCKDVVVGLSGGLDSALTLLVSFAAFRLLGLDEKGIHVYTMPGFGTTRRTRGNADMLAEGLGLRLETIDITAACRQHFKDIRQSFRRHDVTFENAQARERTQILMDKANQLDAIVLGTGDMSEIALGWCTYNGDHMSMFGVNAGVPKTVVREICRWWALEHPGLAADALLDIVATPVSPELLPAKSGKIAQKTEDKVGPYELHDFFIWRFAARNESPAQILSAAGKAFKGQYDAATLKKWLQVFLSRLHRQAFKRNCAPDGVRIFGVYFSPDAWHVPSDVSDEWLR